MAHGTRVSVPTIGSFVSSVQGLREKSKDAYLMTVGAGEKEKSRLGTPSPLQGTLALRCNSVGKLFASYPGNPGSGVQGHLQQHTEFKARLGYMSPSLEKEDKGKRGQQTSHDPLLQQVPFPNIFFSPKFNGVAH